MVCSVELTSVYERCLFEFFFGFYVNSKLRRGDPFTDSRLFGDAIQINTTRKSKLGSFFVPTSTSIYYQALQPKK